jgi:malonate-semialdehyde dehydrogenase (acetylating) / methylmalonate-semialdehyde dehydrogenase
MMRGQPLARRAAVITQILRSSSRHIQTTCIRLAGTTAVKEDYIKHHSQVTTPSETYNFLDNQFKKSSTNRWIELHDPATQNLVTRVPETTEKEMKTAVESAEKAFKTWKNTSLLTRQQILFRLASLIRDNVDRLAASITLEQVRSINNETNRSGQNVRRCQGRCTTRLTSR